jgi:hypothetical protein
VLLQLHVTRVPGLNHPHAYVAEHVYSVQFCVYVCLYTAAALYHGSLLASCPTPQMHYLLQASLC